MLPPPRKEKARDNRLAGVGGRAKASFFSGGVMAPQIPEKATTLSLSHG